MWPDDEIKQLKYDLISERRCSDSLRERIARLENVLTHLQVPLAEMPHNLAYENREFVAQGCLALIRSTLQETEQGRVICERITHLEQQRDHLQARNTELVVRNRELEAENDDCVALIAELHRASNE